MENLKKDYLITIEKLGATPNFFISETYLNQPSLVGREKGGWVWIEEEGKIIFPALPYQINLGWIAPPLSYWAGFPVDADLGEGYEFLDWQYIYNPKYFLSMYGGKWETFRKNSRKFPNKNPNCSYTKHRDEEAVKALLIEWLSYLSDTAEDSEFIANCIMNPAPGDYIKYLYNMKGELIAINYADENYKYINYRFLICKRGEYIDEYARLWFYLDPEIQSKNKLVNDGGTLSNPGLEKFKDKLNPVQKTKIYSHKYKY